MESEGVVLFEGDNDNFAVFRKAAKGCKGLYLNLQPSWTDRDAQQRQSRGLVQVAKEAGLETIVLSTAFHTGDRSKWDNEQGEQSGVRPYYLANAEVEGIVREAGLKHYTILRPAWFHSNYLLPYSAWHFPDLSKKGELVHSYDVGIKMSHIDVDDIGKYAAAALLHPDSFGGQEVELGNENLTIEEAGGSLSSVSGRPINVRRRSPDEVAAAKLVAPTQTFQLWANQIDVAIDGEQIQRKYGIRLTTFKEFLEREKDGLRSTLLGGI